MGIVDVVAGTGRVEYGNGKAVDGGTKAGVVHGNGVDVICVVVQATPTFFHLFSIGEGPPQCFAPKARTTV